MIPTIETLKLVCKQFFGFEPEADIVATNEELIKSIISNGSNTESVEAFYDYVSGDQSHITEEKAYETLRNARESNALCLIDAFTIPLAEIKRRYEIDKVRHKAYTHYTLQVVDEKYPSSIRFSHYLDMLCRCLEENSRIIDNFTSN